MRPRNLLLLIPITCLLTCCKSIDWKGPSIKFSLGYQGVDFGLTLYQSESAKPLDVTVGPKPETPEVTPSSSK